MDPHARLTVDIQYYSKRAHELRRAYIAHLVRRGRAAMFEWIGRFFRFAARPHNSAAH